MYKMKRILDHNLAPKEEQKQLLVPMELWQKQKPGGVQEQSLPAVLLRARAASAPRSAAAASRANAERAAILEGDPKVSHHLTKNSNKSNSFFISNSKLM